MIYLFSVVALQLAGTAVEAGQPEPSAREKVVGESLDLRGLEWLTAEPDSVEGVVRLIRWWTDTCPFCENSLPLIEELRKEYCERGLRTVAVYHPKPPRPTKAQDVIGAAQRLGYTGAVARDGDWSVLRKGYLDRGAVPATSVSFLLDREGRVRYVHPGPDLWPGRENGAAAPRGYLELREAIERLLAENSE